MAEPLPLPGLHLPIDSDGIPSILNLFAHALDPEELGVLMPLTTLREFAMLRIMNQLTDKPGWDDKVFDEAICAKWKAEAIAQSSLAISAKTMDFVIDELRFKAGLFKEFGVVSVYNGDVLKSDIAVPDSVKEALRAAVKPLENVPEVYKDYHPFSEDKVINLVHPSLYPLIYGRSRALMDGLVELEDCTKKTGMGKRLLGHLEEGSLCTSGNRGYSNNYQWLPCEVKFSGPNGEAKITSYINNLHPRKHPDLYKVIEQIIEKAVPLWQMTLKPVIDYCAHRRIPDVGPFYEPDPNKLPQQAKPQAGPDDDEHDSWERDYEWLSQYRRDHITQPEPGVFKAPYIIPDAENPFLNLKNDFNHKGLQVIVKLATIYLTPEKPSYAGGSWHVEGMMNEHICATALYYYDNTNISESRLGFRQASSDFDNVIGYGYEQNDVEWTGAIFGITNDEPLVQVVGDIICKEGRLLTFPNILQHKVQPFGLADPTKPGHRKILALFLIDPHIKILSTANVPPQRLDWWSEEVLSTGRLDKLPKELQDKTFDEVDEFPISMYEAKEIRLRLMEEREKYVMDQDEAFRSYELSLCEH